MKAKLYVEHRQERGMKVDINGEGHMTKLTTMAINSKKTFINLILQNRKNYDFETLPEASVIGALQSLNNHDPRLTLTYLMARSAEIAYPRSQVSVYRTIGPLVYTESCIFLIQFYVPFKIISAHMRRANQ